MLLNAIEYVAATERKYWAAATFNADLKLFFCAGTLLGTLLQPFAGFLPTTFPCRPAAFAHVPTVIPC
jgi:hypothetical protein